jgi:hypothetical protein
MGLMMHEIDVLQQKKKKKKRYGFENIFRPIPPKIFVQ